MNMQNVSKDTVTHCNKRKFLRFIKALFRHAINSLKTRNTAWNEQKYALAIDELKLALIDRTMSPAELLLNLQQKSSLSALEKHEAAILTALCNPEKFSSAKNRYRALITHLRQGLSCNENSVLLNTLCNARFTEVNLHTFGQSLVENMIHTGVDTVTNHPICKTNYLQELPVDAQLEAMTHYPRNPSTYLKVQLGKLKATINHSFDPHIQTNVPHKQLEFSIDNDQHVTMIGMGTPTIEDGSSPAKINPEFRHFILNHSGSHLYINLQNNAPKWRIGDESARVRVLTAFSEASSGKLTLITLAQDSLFYHQKGSFGKEILSIKAFITRLITYLQSGQHGYACPAPKNTSFWTELENDLQIYARAIFDKQLDDPFSKNERRDFIELSYPVIIHHFLKECSATSMNITCKDGIDRAGKAQGLFIQYLAIGEPSGFTTERKKLMAAICLARAPIVKAQPMILSRRRRFLSALDRTNEPSCQTRLQKQFWSTKKERPSIQAPIHKESQTAISC